MLSERLQKLELTLEEQRKAALQVIIKRSLFSLALLGATVWVVFTFLQPAEKGQWAAFGFFCLIVLILFGFWTVMPIIIVKAKIKKFVTPELVAATSPLRVYWPEKYDVDRFGDWQVMPYHTDVVIDDVVAGQVDGAEFEFVEMHLDYRTTTSSSSSSGSSSKNRRVFSGFLLHIESPKEKPDLLIVESHDSKKKPLKRTGMQSSPIGETEYIASVPEDQAPPSVPEELVDLLRQIGKRFKASRVAIAYFQSKVVLLVATKMDLFEIDVKKQLDLAKELPRFKEQTERLQSTLNDLGYQGPVEATQQEAAIKESEFSEDSDIFASGGCLPALLALTLGFAAIAVAAKSVFIAIPAAAVLSLIVGFAMRKRTGSDLL